MDDPSQKKILIVGAGIGAWQLSLEAVKALEDCDEIWTNVYTAICDGMPDRLRSKTQSLKPFFLPNRPRIANYRAIIAHILERASSLRRVAYLTQGHPLIFDSVASGLLEESPLLGIDVRVIAGISCIDTILIDVMYDPARGLQIHEATTFVRAQVAVDTRAALLLLQPWVFGSSMPRLTVDALGPDLNPLAASLKQIYPEKHRVKFVRSASGTAQGQVFEIEIGRLAETPTEAVVGSSLFIPPYPRQ